MPTNSSGFIRQVSLSGVFGRHLVTAGCVLSLIATCLVGHSVSFAQKSRVVGQQVTPHTVAPEMQYRQPRGEEMSAHVRLFVKGPTGHPRFDEQSPAELVAEGEWAWQDVLTVPAATQRARPEDSLTVWSFNGKSSQWGRGRRYRVEAENLPAQEMVLEPTPLIVTAVTYLAEGDATASQEVLQPNTLVMHLHHRGEEAIRLSGLNLWLPQDRESWHTLFHDRHRPLEQVIEPGERGYIKVPLGALPLTYAAIELETDQGSVWSWSRIKAEVFDISGGWIGEHLSQEAYLKLLSSLHVNTGQFQEVAGYSNRPALAQRYPMKAFNRMLPLEKYDTEEWLPRIHAVEFLGEPQYGGGRPVPPQEVLEAFLPYRTSRLATTVTHSEERIWRWYAGLSDYPHFDAYRVVAPAADAWRRYDRWDGESIRWGAPLETIGAMTRCLREINRPLPCAAWSQGPHDGWESWFDGRQRRSPNPDELRAQALHALSSRITSLYWFNLSLKSLLLYPDTWEPIRYIGREIKMLAPYYLAGEMTFYQRLTKADGKPDWDVSTVAAPQAAVLFALDLDYRADPEQNEFIFGQPRAAEWQFELPPWLRNPVDVFQVNAQGIFDVRWQPTTRGVRISTTASRDALFVVAKNEQERLRIAARRESAMAHELQHEVSLEQLQTLLK